MARPSLYTPELVEHIAERLSQGEPMAQICRDEGMPAYRTVKDWIDIDASVSADIARAREAGFDQIALDALRIADHAAGDIVDNGDGSVTIDRELVQRSKLRVETRLKLLAKWDPKRYGDRQVLAGDPDSPLIPTTPDDQLDVKIAAFMARMK